MSSAVIRRKEIFVSVVIRVRDAAAFVEPALTRLIGVMERNFDYYEIILVDDASVDATREIIGRMQQRARNIQLYCLARRRGDNIALTAGLDHAIGDMIVTMDLRVDPPEVLAEMVDLAAGGVEIVYGLPRERIEKLGIYNRLLSWFVYVLSRINQIDVPPAVSGYRLLSRSVLNFMLEAPDRHRTLMTLPAVSGYPHATIAYDRLIRHSEGPRTGRREAMMKGLDLIFSSSTRPLRIITLMSLGICVLTLGYAVLVVAIALFKEDVAKGWASLSLQVSSLFFLVCIVLAVMSEYLLQILETTKGQVRYHIASQSHSSTVSLARELNVVSTRPDAADEAPR